MNEKEPTLIEALLKARAEFKPVKKNTTNPFFKSQYADLGQYIDAVKDALAFQGILVVQKMSYDPSTKQSFVNTVLMRNEEALDCGLYPVVVAKQNDPQAFASAVTYARRYSLAAALFLVSEDDDGNAGAEADPDETFLADLKKQLWETAKKKYDTNAFTKLHDLSIMMFEQSLEELDSEQLAKLLKAVQNAKG